MYPRCRLVAALLLPGVVVGVAVYWWPTPVVVAAAVPVATLVCAVQACRLSSRLAAATEAARQLAAGDFSVRLPVHGAPEYRALAEALNGMAGASAGREEQLNRALDDAAHQRDLFYSIINASGDGLLLYGDARQLLAANLRCGELLGISVHDLLTAPRETLQDRVASRADAPQHYQARLERHFSRPDQPHQDVLVLRHPQRRVLRRSSSPIISQRGIQGRVFTYTDVTVEADLDRMKSDFVSMTSHELRTPLTSVHGALQLVLTGSGDRLAVEDRELLEISLTSTERLVRLVSDLLDLSKIEAGRMPLVLAPVPVGDLLGAAAKAMHGFASTRDARVIVEDEAGNVALRGDRDHLLRVLSNLLSNALKYSAAGTAVRLTARPAREGIEIAVEDQGPGVPAAEVDRLFQPFSRLGAHQRQTTGGTGLGLAISRAIVEQHGGRIWMEHRTPSGSRFVFLIPSVERLPDADPDAAAVA